MSDRPDSVACGAEFLEDGSTGCRVTGRFQGGPVAGDHLGPVGCSDSGEQFGRAIAEFRVAMVGEQLSFFEREVGGEDATGCDGIQQEVSGLRALDEQVDDIGPQSGAVSFPAIEHGGPGRGSRVSCQCRDGRLLDGWWLTGIQLSGQGGHGELGWCEAEQQCRGHSCCGRGLLR